MDLSLIEIPEAWSEDPDPGHEKEEATDDVEPARAGDRLRDRSGGRPIAILRDDRVRLVACQLDARRSRANLVPVDDEVCIRVIGRDCDGLHSRLERRAGWDQAYRKGQPECECCSMCIDHELSPCSSQGRSTLAWPSIR